MIKPRCGHVAESDPAKSERIMKEAVRKPGGRHYMNLVQLQIATREMKQYRKETLKLVVDNDRKPT